MFLSQQWIGSINKYLKKQDSIQPAITIQLKPIRCRWVVEEHKLLLQNYSKTLSLQVTSSMIKLMLVLDFFIAGTER